MLRNAETEAVDDLRVDGVPQRAQRFEESGEHRAVVPGGQVGDVLHEHGVGLQTLNDRHERSPQLGAGILSALPVTDEITQASSDRRG